MILNAVATVDAKFDVAPAALGIGSGLRSGTASPDTQAGPPAPGPSAALKLGRPAAQGVNTLVLEATLPVAGTLTATAKGLKRAHAGLGAPGLVELRLHLNRRGRNALARSKAGRLSMRVAVSFTPSDGAPGSVVGKTVTFRKSGAVAARL